MGVEVVMLEKFEQHVKGFVCSDILSSKELKANFALGLAGESGEVVDLIKKDLYHGKDIDRVKLIKELGDVAWYWVALCQQYAISPSEVMQVNIEKLQQRHGGTSFDRSRSEFGKESENEQ
jgi:NTP pyrophosphatase (non-canonical NTP hydrolase)